MTANQLPTDPRTTAPAAPPVDPAAAPVAPTAGPAPMEPAGVPGAPSGGPLPGAPAAVPTPGAPTGGPAPVAPANRPAPEAYGLQARAAGSPWWKGLLSLLAVAAAYLVVNVVLSVAGLVVGRLLGLPGVVNAATLAGLNLSWALMIPIAPAIMRAIHGVPRTAFGSLHGGLRWGRMARSLLWVVPLYLLSTVLVTLVGPTMGDGHVTGALLAIGAVVALTTPLQAAGEEFTFRGAAWSAAATWGPSPRAGLVIGAVVSSLLFGLAHGSTDPWLFAYYVAFGAGLAVTALLTRGLEVAVAVHAVNNVVSFGTMIVTGADPETMFDRSSGVGGPFMLVPIAAMAAVCAITWLVERRRAALAG